MRRESLVPELPAGGCHLVTDTSRGSRRRLGRPGSASSCWAGGCRSTVPRWMTRRPRRTRTEGNRPQVESQTAATGLAGTRPRAAPASPVNRAHGAPAPQPTVDRLRQLYIQAGFVDRRSLRRWTCQRICRAVPAVGTDSIAIRPAQSRPGVHRPGGCGNRHLRGIREQSRRPGRPVGFPGPCGAADRTCPRGGDRPG